jgi:hypothetical protein
MKAAPEGVAMAIVHFNEVETALAVLDEGWARAALCLRTGGAWRYAHKEGSINARSLPQVKAAIDVWKTRFEAGDTLALLQAIDLCAAENMPLPTWLAIEFSRKLQTFFDPGGAHSLDDVFKSPTLPTNTAKRAVKAKRDWEEGVALLDACWKEAHANEHVTSLDAVLDRVLVSKKWSVKKRRAYDLVIWVDESQAQHLQKREKQPLARFLEKRRKQ